MSPVRKVYPFRCAGALVDIAQLDFVRRTAAGRLSEHVYELGDGRYPEALPGLLENGASVPNTPVRLAAPAVPSRKCHRVSHCAAY